MKNLLNKIRFERLNIAALAMAFVCAGLFGCSDDVVYDLAESRTGAKVVGFINDSLVIVEDYRYWSEYIESWNGSYSVRSGCENTRLCIYNYRVQEDGPRWCDSTEGKTNYTGQLSDSVVWSGLYGSRGSLILWKAGGRRSHLSVDNKTDGCRVSFDAASIHQWLADKFIVIGKQSLNAGGDSCQYAVLDTVGRTLVYKRFDEDLKWVEKCDDVRAWGEDVYCMILDKDDGNSVMLKNAADTIEMPRIFAIGGFWGDMLKLSGRLCSFKNDVANCADVTWYGNEIKFYRDDGIIVEY